MKTIYADDTYGRTDKSGNVRPIHIFGGIIVDSDYETAIIEKLRAVKSKYTHQNMPIKWNFKDKSIKDKYEEFNRAKEYQVMLEESKDWRTNIFREIQNIPYTILASCIKNFSNEKKGVAARKNDLNTYCFENLLMRAGQEAREKPGTWQCVLDWPPDSNSKPFDSAYYQLFHFGKTNSTRAHCGPLEKLGFSHSLHFTKANHSPLLQIADLAIGAIKDHLECHIEARGACLGSEVVEIFYSHIRNVNGRIPKYGIACSSGNKDLSEIVNVAFKKSNRAT